MLPPTSVAGTAVAPAVKAPTWERRLSDVFWINSVAISNDGSRVVAATFLHNYRHKGGKGLPNVQGRFAVVCFDEKRPRDPKQDPDAPIVLDEYDGWDGVFGVALSGDGSTAAAAGWSEKTGNGRWGLLRAYDMATGKTLLDYPDINHRVSWVVLSENGRVLAAVADDVYLFFRGGKAFNPIPVRLGIGGTANRYVTNVAIHPDGTWLAACDQIGHVYAATIDTGNAAVSRPFEWTAPGGSEIPFLSVAIARQKQTFAVGGGNSIFLFDMAAIRAGSGTVVLEYDTTNDVEPGMEVPPNKKDGRIEENVRWVAISADGTLVTAVANRTASVDGQKKPAGMLVAVEPVDKRLRHRWRQPLDSYPNCTSVDAAGKHVAACDGYPTGKPAKFYLFDAQGDPLWYAVTHNMNWPIAICAEGNAIAAGSDDGAVYYFTP